MAEGGQPELSEQVKIIKRCVNKKLKKGDIWYLINTNWFTQWKAFVGYDNLLDLKSSYIEIESIESETSKSIVSERTCLSQVPVSGFEKSMEIYPGPIDNSSLYKTEEKVLREGLVQNVDYEVLPVEAYTLLASWYGTMKLQQPIMRKVIEGADPKKLQVEIHLLELKLCHNFDTSNIVTMAFSKSDSIDTVEHVMRHSFKIPDMRDVRMWICYSGKSQDLLNRKLCTVQDAGLHLAQMVVAESKIFGSPWPKISGKGHMKKSIKIEQAKASEDLSHLSIKEETSPLLIEKKIVGQSLGASLKKGEIRYLIDETWFKLWKRYVGFNLWDSAQGPTLSPGPIDNSLLIMTGTNTLRKNLIQDQDYVLLTENAYKKLASWYGVKPGQQPIIRKVIEHGNFVKLCVVEVYPLDLKLSDGKFITTFSFSREDKVALLEQEMRKIFVISDEKDVRLWKRQSNKSQLLTAKDMTLENVGLFNDQIIFIEVKNEDGSWPRQVQTVASTREPPSKAIPARMQSPVIDSQVTRPSLFTEMSSPIVKSVLDMDVPLELVEKSIKKRLLLNQGKFESVEALMDDIFNPSSEETKSGQCSVNLLRSTQLSDEQLKEYEALKKLRQCKICLDKEACVTFKPCGHHVTCKPCADSLTVCPICRKKIEEKIRTFMQ
ncbi:unnamed protein product [Lymnaea stagnalis]|uniref:Uncharacterized protein n=1 Tax=Lymnaea stagnalis TaxID=6523 RepID=A0AAV2I8H1_LYMST